MAKKMYISSLDDLNENEKSTKTVSYARLCERAFDDMILCNNILEVDEGCIDNLICGSFYDYLDEDGNYVTKEDYDNDMEGKIEEQPKDFYQYFIVTPYYDEEWMQEHYGDDITLMYSDKLDNYILAVDHFGTSWTYVPTSIEYTTNFEEE